MSGSHGAVGWALVDSVTGLPLASSVAPTADLDSDVMGLIGAGAAAQFKRCSEGEEILEIQTATDDAYYFIARVPDDSDQLAVLVLDRAETNLGLGWMAMRRALSDLEVASSEAEELADRVDQADDGMSSMADRDAAAIDQHLVGAAPHPPPADAPHDRRARRSIRR